MGKNRRKQSAHLVYGCPSYHSTTMTAALNTLKEYQKKLHQLLEKQTEEICMLQHDPQLSPLAWHLGHCAFIENYWLQETVFNRACPTAMKDLYIPERSIKCMRGEQLPNLSHLKDWVKICQNENHKLLTDHRSTHPLLTDDFLINFFINHYAQHIETCQIILAQYQLKQSYTDFKVRHVLQASPLQTTSIVIESGTYQIGHQGTTFSYDNEKPLQEITINAFNIAKAPISNSEFLAFMEDGGYQQKKYWQNASKICGSLPPLQAPHHWKKNDRGHWFGINSNGPYELVGDTPVNGLCLAEAMAFSNWAGARLTHEYEWEIAAKKQHLQQIGVVWEWCYNLFHAYPGFHPFPYKGYSVPYFKNHYFTLKGSSIYSQTAIQRNSFRNYYEPLKRHIFAGVRLVFNH